MSLYQSLFSPKGITASQLLLTQADFEKPSHLKNLTFAVERLLSLGIVPIVNENDAVSVVQTDEMDGTPMFSDNDSLAALVARTFGAEVLLLLTDVNGVYDKPPSVPGAKIIHFHHSDSTVKIGDKSTQGRGGMAAKIQAASNAVKPGSACTACVVAAGCDLNTIRSILGREHKPELGKPKGTLFATPGSDLEKQAIDELVVAMDVSDWREHMCVVYENSLDLVSNKCYYYLLNRMTPRVVIRLVKWHKRHVGKLASYKFFPMTFVVRFSTRWPMPL